MPKMKTHKSGAKRYRVTGTGKIMRSQAGRGHLNQKKSSKRKRALDHSVVVHPGNLKKLSLELPYMKYAR
ncbi:MAG: 50S ribosomal protein L35 [Cyanobacteria bacterium]|jgi:large subunit ribosomal protein L35|nr:50S ribosomal protein L35 [Cyanobacteriota bacterium]